MTGEPGEAIKFFGTDEPSPPLRSCGRVLSRLSSTPETSAISVSAGSR